MTDETNASRGAQPGVTATQAVLVYSIRTKVPRRIIVPDDDNDIASIRQSLSAGERAVSLARTGLTVARIRQFIAAFENISESAIPSGRCAVVDLATGTITAVVMADPGIDAIPGTTLIETDVGDIGDTWDGTNIIKPPSGPPRWVPHP